MSEPSDTNIWFLLGSACGGVFAGVGSVLGLNRVKGKGGENGVSELDKVRIDLDETRKMVSNHEVFYQTTTITMQQIHRSLERLHERMDGLEKSVARIEGIDEGRKSRKGE